MSAITAKASRKMKKYAVLTREPRCFLGSFDFSWEQRKLGELGTITTGSTPSTSIPDYYSDDGIVWVTPTDICENITFESARKLSDLGQQVGRVVPKNTILVTCIASIGKNTMLGNTGSFNQQINGLTPNENECDPYFLLTESALWSAKMKSSAAAGTMQIVNRTEFSELKTWLPSLIEQQAISDFFRQLDDLITLHQRKCVFLFGFFQAFISMIFTASTFSWEQRKFEEIAVRSSVICSDDTLPRVEYEDIVSGTGRLNKDIYAKQSIKSGIAFHQGDVLYGKLRPYLQNWLLPTFDGLAVGDFWVLQPQNADSSFLYRLIQSRQFDEVANQSTGTKMPRADWKLVSKTVFSIPSNISEQAAIGTYFTALDSLITLHQRECISFTARAGRRILTANKKRNTSSWEQRKLGEVGETYTGLSGKSKDDFGHGSGKFITYMNVFSNPVASSNMTEAIEIDDSQNKVQFGDVLFTTSSETPDEVGMSSVWLENAENTYLNSFCFGYRPTTEYNPYYLAYMLRSSSMRKKITFLAQGISRYNISKNKMMDIEMPIPSIDEQKQIGEYFRNLDNLITLHQRKPFLMKWRTSDANRNKTNRLVL